MYFHHGIAGTGTVGDVGGNMNVMQQKKRNVCSAMLSEKKKKEYLIIMNCLMFTQIKLAFWALVKWYIKRSVVN